MQVKHPYLLQLIKAIDLEESEEDLRFRLDKQHSLKLLKAEGLALHPIIITGKNYGYGDYPEIGFRLPFPPEGNHFRDGSAVECFLPGEEPVKGILLFIDGSAGAVRLNLPDYPDWIEENGLAIKLSPDLRTLSIMRKILKELDQNKELLLLFTLLHDKKIATTYSGHSATDSVEFQNTQLNASQRNAVRAILENEKLVVVHGPPGTGKTTTLVEAICQLVKSNEKIVVSAPSNMAVDNIAKVLISRGMKVLRVGNSSKVD
ncbi:MAG: ATPase, T2SS/T4P/T4SS family, partial [Ginsengibacter sp.]